jgi:hypothetical protein
MYFSVGTEKYQKNPPFKRHSGFMLIQKNQQFSISEYVAYLKNTFSYLLSRKD